MPVFNNALAGAAGSGGAAAYTIERSLRLNSGDQSKLTRTPSTEGNTKTWTLSWWMKAPEVDSTIFAAGNGNTPGRFSFGTNGNGAFFASVVDNNSSVFSITTDAFFRDPSAWYHCCLICDSTATTQADRFKIIVNGVRQSVTGTLMPSNQNTFVNTTQNHQWSGRSYLNIDYADGYLAEIQFVDGQALDETSFGEFDAETGVWNPIKFSDTYNTAAVGTTYSGMMTADGGFAVSATKAFDGDTTTEARANLSGDNYLEFTPTTPISFTNGVHVWCYSPNGYDITTYWSVDLDGNGLGSETSFVGSSTAGFNGSAWVQVATGSGTLYKVRIRLTRSNGSSGAAIGAIAINGTSASDILVDGTPAGVNGYKLDFSDVSSNAALGFNANVSGTRYSAYMTGSINSSYPYANLFDGNTSTFMLGTNGAIQTWTPGTGIDWTDSAGGVEVYFHNTSSVDKVRINGGSWVVQQVSTGGWEKVSTGDGTLTKMEFSDNSNQETAVYAIRINGTILTDPAGANDWTVTNLNASGLSNTPGVTTQVPDSVTGDWLGILGITPTNTNGTFATIPDGGGPTLPDKGKFYWSGLAVGDVITLYGTGSGSNRSVTGDVDEASSPGYVAVPGSTLGSFTVTVTSASGSCKVDHNGAFTCYGITPGPLAGHNFDDLIDTPTNYEADSGNNIGNYCTLNPLKSRLTLTNGNLDSTSPTDWKGAAGTIGMSSGKFYWEIDNVVGNEHVVGIVPYNTANVTWNTTYGYGAETGVKYLAAGGVSYGAAWTTGDVIGVAFDADSGILEFYKNGTSQGIAATGLTDGPYLPSVVHNGTSRSSSINFGQRPWKYTPKADHVALCTANLPEPGVADGSTAFDVKLWNGNNTTQDVTGYSFSPDFVWTKQRTNTGFPALFDTVRGVHNAVRTTSTGGTYTDTGLLTAFNSDGFSVGSAGDINSTNNSYVGWGWDGGTVGAYEVGDYWSPPTYKTKYIGFKFPTSSGGRAVFGLIAGTGTADIYTSSDNSNWTRVQSNVTLSTTDTTYDSTSQYLIVVNTTDAVWDNRHYAMATSGTDAHYSTTAYPGSGATLTWTGPAYTDWDFRSSGTVIKPAGLNSAAYDQSQGWSALDTWPAASYSTDSSHVFNGVYGGTATADFWYSSGASTVNLSNLATALGTGVSNIKIWFFDRSGDVTVTVNSTTATESSDNAYQEISIDHDGSAITTFTIQGTDTSYWGIGGIKVDGKLLVDGINDSVTWSNSLAALSGSSLTNPANGFDTDEDSYADSTAGFTLDLSNHTFGTGAHTIEVKSGGATSFSVNGSTSLSGSGSGAIVWSGTHTGELTSLTSSASGASVYYVKIDGKYLANPGQNYVTSVPSRGSTVRANPSAGFSIATFHTPNPSGTFTYAHGLNSAPEFVIHKFTDVNSNFYTYHKSIGQKYINLNGPDGEATSEFTTGPTSSVFTYPSSLIVGPDEPVVAYSFTSIEGYSSIGSYVGNGLSDGAFVYTGFRPAFIIVKSTSATGGWRTYDSTRRTYNVINNSLHFNTSEDETVYSNDEIDFLSNGFKCRALGSFHNGSGVSYLYYAVAENPFKTARAR